MVQIDYRKDERYWVGALGTQVNFFTEVNFPGDDSCAKSQRALARIFLLALPGNKAKSGIEYYDNNYPSSVLEVNPKAADVKPTNGVIGMTVS